MSLDITRDKSHWNNDSVWAMTDLITCNKKEASLTSMILILIRLIYSVKILTH